jgi:short-subunit dehydrogenase
MSNVIITGTSRGIGFELAQVFARNNHHVLAISRNSKPLAHLNIKNISCVSIDLSHEDELEEIAQFVSDNWKTVDILINNAGKLINKPFKEISSKEFIEVYKINVFAVSTLTKLMIPFLNRGSHVVNISSIGGVQGSSKFPGLSAYSSSKGAILTLTEVLAEEYKEDGIAFNALALGAVQTEMLEEAFPGYQAPVNATDMADYIYNFAINGNKYYNGKILQVSSSTP